MFLPSEYVSHVLLGFSLQMITVSARRAELTEQPRSRRGGGSWNVDVSRDATMHRQSTSALQMDTMVKHTRLRLQCIKTRLQLRSKNATSAQSTHTREYA